METSRVKRISPTRVLEKLYNDYKHTVNLGGKGALGIMALQNKIHAILKSIPGKIPLYYSISEDSPLKRKLKVRLRHNQDSAGNPTISENLNVNGIRIADINSHTMNGQLDVEKDAWVFNIQADITTTPMLGVLTEIGASEKEVYYFVSNPLVKEYKKLKLENKSKLKGLKPEREKASAATEIINQNIPEATIAALNNQIQYAAVIDILSQLKNEVEELRIRYVVPGTEKTKTVTVAPSQFDKSLLPYIETISSEENTLFIKDKSHTLETPNGRYFASEILFRQLKGEEKFFTLKELQDSAKNKASNSLNLAIFLNFLELESGLYNYIDFKKYLNPDTKLSKTVFQKYKNNIDYNKRSRLPGVDDSTAKVLREESVLASFFSNDIAIDIISELFPLRLNEKVNQYLIDILGDRRFKEWVTNNYRSGQEGEQMFTSEFNNAIINYIYQNVMNNFTDQKGLITNRPETFKKKSVTYTENKVDHPTGIKFEENKITVNPEQVLEYITTSEDSMGLLETRDITWTRSSVFRFIMEKEYLAQVVYTSVDQLSKNPLFWRIKEVYGTQPKETKDESDKVLLNTFVAQKALLNTYNRKALMTDPALSYSQLVMDVIELFPNLQDKYPVLEQLQVAEFALKRGLHILTLKNKKNIDDTLAQTYEQNIRQLADINIEKHSDPEINSYISNLFQQFSLAALYQNGFGFSAFGMNKIINGERAMNIMRTPTIQFSQRALSNTTDAEAFLNEILNKLVKNKGAKYQPTTHNNYTTKAVEFNKGASFDTLAIQPEESTQPTAAEVKTDEQLKLNFDDDGIIEVPNTGDSC
jgi:hypothetical protein